MQSKLFARLGISLLVAFAATDLVSAAPRLAFAPQHGEPSQGPKPKKPTGGGYTGPGDSVPANPGGGNRPADGGPPAGDPSSDKPGAGRRPAAGALPPNAPQGPTSPFLPATIAGEASNDANWWMWWEFNKTEFLRPNRLQLKLGLRTGVETPRERDALVQAMLDQLRDALRVPLSNALTGNDAVERAEAVGAVGRMAGPTAVETLIAALGDPSLVVRDRAILALGAIATEPSFAALSRIAETGVVRDGGQISGNARPLAIAALAIGRRAGFDDRADRLVERVVRARPTGIGDRLAVSAMIYQTVAPCAVLEKLAFDLARDENVSMPVRCRALEAVARAGTDEAFALVETALRGPDLELRRSAAIALATTRHARASSIGVAALEHEVEPVARGFLALSLGRIGDGISREALIARIAGDAVDRPWAALGLGLLVRQSGDPVALGTLRKSASSERSVDARPAFWIALGLARDLGSVGMLAGEIASNSDPIRQHYAATALALIGDATAHDALAARVALEKKPLPYVTVSAALGLFGRSADVALLAANAKSLRQPDLQAVDSLGLAYLGALECVDPLSARLVAKDSSSIGRAGACAALGILLSRNEPLILAEGSRSSNYTVYEVWMDELVQSTL
ncbi:MAG: HEAT repeat domain-containing protein [Planctomycetes bacterium]|nr:HEAT repeat domain-containing protein [Planctomycetota bacterium]